MSKVCQLPALIVLLFFSGFAGLGYEIIWAKTLSAGLGHEIVAILAVVAAFFSGLALGAYLLDDVVSRSAYPGRWYAFFELLIAAWAVTLIFAIPYVNEWLPTLIGVEPSAPYHWFIAFAAPFMLLAPATIAMGGTLPAMERFFANVTDHYRNVGGVYAANTLGACAGTMLITFLIIPELGIRASLLVLASVNVLCAIGVLMMPASSPSSKAKNVATPKVSGPVEISAERLFATLFITGLLGIGYEVLVIRVLSQVLENTVYSFASLLSVYLLGTAIGAALYQRFSSRDANFSLTLSYLAIVTAVACLCGLLCLAYADFFNARAYAFLKDNWHAAIVRELTIAGLVFLVPTIAMGALFSHLAQAARKADGGFGRALGLNTLGAAMAPLVFGVIALPLFGAAQAILIICAGFFLIVPRLKFRTMLYGTPAAALIVILVVRPLDLRFLTVPKGGAVIAHKHGVMAAVSVVSDAQGQRHLKVNDRFRMGSTASYYSDRRQAQVPLLLHPDPREALFLGLGTGGTLAGVIDHPKLKATGVELVPDVLNVMPLFSASLDGLLENDRVRFTVADARRYVQASTRNYDVIIADVFHPSRDGAGSLYTVEHFTAVRERLAPGGVFCQWLPLYQLDDVSLRLIIRTFLHVFPNATAHMAHYSLLTPMLCLAGSAEPRRYRQNWVTKRDTEERLRAALKKIELNSDFSFFGTFVGGAGDLKKFARQGVLNTDDRPLVTYIAPSAVYGPSSSSWVRLHNIIENISPKPRDIFQAAPFSRGTEGAGDNKKFSERLAAYWRARDAFLRLGMNARPTQGQSLEGLAGELSKPLLGVLALSPDFDPAYKALIGLARNLAKVAPDKSAELLQKLYRADPRRDGARRLYAALFKDRKPLQLSDREAETRQERIKK